MSVSSVAAQGPTTCPSRAARELASSVSATMPSSRSAEGLAALARVRLRVIVVRRNLTSRESDFLREQRLCNAAWYARGPAGRHGERQDSDSRTGSGPAAAFAATLYENSSRSLFAAAWLGRMTEIWRPEGETSRGPSPGTRRPTNDGSNGHARRRASRVAVFVLGAMLFMSIVVGRGTARPMKTDPDTPADRSSPQGIPGDWTLTFDDEFNGHSVDLTKWRPNWLASSDTAITKPVNVHELSCY